MIEDQRATFSGVPDEAAVHSETLSRRQKDWLEAAGSVATLDWRQGSDSGSERSIVDASQAALGFSEALSMLPARESFGGAGSAPPFDPAVMSTGGEPATGLAPNGAPAGADDSVGATTPPPRNPFNGAGGHGTADYLLRKKIGEGGMGVVWQATQTSLSREVAVKRLKGDADWMDFLQEAFTSAELDHPNIVPVHDLARLADSASGGQATPAIAMKMVTGTAWNVLIKSDRKAADLTREDFLAKHLRILIDVCHAVAYAHAKHIVHRDLKPHQVMLGEFGEVFLMDWGLAITMLEEAPTVPGQGIPKHRSRTTGGNPCGSPAYMAPEQTDATAARLGPATDIYLLGAILYELVCGHPPHYAENGRAAFALATANERDPVPPDAPEELLALIEEALATKPEERPASVALFRDRIEDYLSGAGKRRESRELAGKARQKLDEAEADYGVLSECLAIAARSRALWSDNPALPPLEADIFHAYAEAAISHGDLTLAKVHAERIAASDPRRAESVARVARLEALSRRREGQRRLAIATVVLLAIGVLATLLFALDSRSQRQIAMRDGQLSRERADRLEKERELADERSLRLEAARAEQERIANLFERVNDLRRDENLFAKELAASFPAPRSLNGNDEYDINEVSAQFLQARGVVLSMDGLTTVDLDEVAELEDRRAKLAERRKELAAMVGEERLEQEPTALTLSEANMQLKLALSPSGALAAYGLFEQAKSQLPQDPDPLVGMAVAAARADHVTSAIALLEEAAVLARRAYGEDSPRTADVLGLAGDAAIQLGDDEAVFRYFNRSSDLLEERWIDLTKKLYLHTYHTGDFRRANELAEIVLAAKERNHPRDSWEVQSAKITYSSLLLWKGDLDKAEELILDAIDSMEGDDESTRMHRAQAMAKLARIQTMRGHYREAEAMLREAQDALEDTDLDASNRGAIRTQLADCLFLQGNYQESLGMFEEAEAILVAAQGGQHPNAIIARNGRVRVLKALGRFAEAERMLRDQMAALDEIALDPDHSLRGNTLHSLAAVLGDQGRFRDAVPVIAETLRIYRLKYPPNSTRTAEVLGTISNIQKQLGNMAEAVTAARESLAIWNLRDDPLNPNRLNVLNTLAVVLDNSGEEHREEAARLYQEALEGMKAIGHKKDGIASTMGNLAVTLTRLGRKEEAEKLLRDALDLQVEALGPRHPFVGVRHNSLAFNLMGQARYDDAEPHLRAALDIQRETLGDHIDTGISLYNLAQNLGYQGKWEEGEPLLDEAIKLFIEAGGDRHPHVAAARGVKARLLESQKRYLEAAETRRQLASHWEIVEGLASTKAVNERDSVAVNLYRAEAWKEAAAWMAGNYRLDDKTTELAYRRLEWLGLCLLRSGEHADAAAPIATALRWQVARAEGDPVRDSLSRKFASSLLEVVASAPTERADHALALRLSAWLEHGDASVESTSIETVSVDLGWGTAGRLAAQSTALAASNPASLDAAKRLALRAAALANAAKLGPEHRARLLWLDPLLARLGLAEEASALPAPPETLWPGPATAPVQSAALTAWLDEVVPPVDWSALAPDAAAWTIDQLEPRGEELARALEKSVERAAELGDGPAAARLRAKN